MNGKYSTPGFQRWPSSENTNSPFVGISSHFEVKPPHLENDGEMGAKRTVCMCRKCSLGEDDGIHLLNCMPQFDVRILWGQLQLQNEPVHLVDDQGPRPTIAPACPALPPHIGKKFLVKPASNYELSLIPETRNLLGSVSGLKISKISKFSKKFRGVRHLGAFHHLIRKFPQENLWKLKNICRAHFMCIWSHLKNCAE